ncbi:MAG TPA: RagB/SusD family nutrient uptake outer membrane protein, partial [Prolixibacteraceae bacterium]
MKNKINKISLLLLIVLMGGCSKEFLNIPPQNNVITANFLKTDDQVLKAIVGLYDREQTMYSSAWNGMRFIQNVISDDAQSAGPNAFDTPEYDALDKFDWQVNNTKIRGLWQRLFEIVASANAIITPVEAMTNSTPGMKQMVAEAKALRAHAYLELVIMFGDVPLMIKNPVLPSEYNKPRTPKAQIYTQIESDLNAAIADLPAKSAYAAGNKYRFSKGTAQYLLGKAYIYQKKWSDAANVLGQLIASNEFDLLPKERYMDNFLKAGEFGSESLFEASYTSQLHTTWGTNGADGTFDARLVEVNIQMQLEGPRDDNGFFSFVDYHGDPTKWSDGLRGGWGFNLPSKVIGDVLKSDPSDIRSADVLSDAEFKALGGKVQASPVPYMYQGYLRVKYGCRISETDPTSQPELNYGSNIRVMRYADALLMAAEAYHMNNQDNLAVIELNKVRLRAGLPATALTGDALMSLIKLERQKELCFEGSRFYDLVRWGDAPTV